MKPINLLHEFLNSSSNISPLEATEQEQLEEKFQAWFDQKLKDFEFVSHLSMQSVAKVFDPYQTLIVTFDRCEILRAEKVTQTDEYISD